MKTAGVTQLVGTICSALSLSLPCSSSAPPPQFASTHPRSPRRSISSGKVDERSMVTVHAATATMYIQTLWSFLHLTPNLATEPSPRRIWSLSPSAPFGCTHPPAPPRRAAFRPPPARGRGRRPPRQMSEYPSPPWRRRRVGGKGEAWRRPTTACPRTEPSAAGKRKQVEREDNRDGERGPARRKREKKGTGGATADDGTFKSEEGGRVNYVYNSRVKKAHKLFIGVGLGMSETFALLFGGAAVSQERCPFSTGRSGGSLDHNV